MLKKKISSAIVITLFLITAISFVPKDKTYKVENITSPNNLLVGNKTILYDEITCFDPYFSDRNNKISKDFLISETEAFLMGNLGKYWAKNLMQNRNVYIDNNSDLIFNKYSYRTKLINSGFCIKKDDKISEQAFNTKLTELRRAKYYVIDLKTEKFYKPEDKEVRSLKDFIVIRKSHLPKIKIKELETIPEKESSHILIKDKIKIIFADSTSKIIPDRNCSSEICKEILNSIEDSKNTIDIAIYGYSKTPVIEKALQNAIKRGVQIRLVYDSDSNGNNIYPDTKVITDLIKQNISDKNSIDSRNIMHNKFYIFDNKKLITGSANLSHTDMSGFNSNSIISVESDSLAKIYKQEFEQMYYGKFHSEKASFPKSKTTISETEIQAYFSPQDKSITNIILPLIRNAKQYIYIPTFVLTERRVTEELIKAKQRGVDIKIIIDALNASIRHSKHKELRLGRIPTKTENYAGKMHSKSMIIDDEYTIIGSMNFSNSGENRNDENLLVIKDKQITKFYKEFFMYQWNKIPDKWLKYNARAEGKDSIGSCDDGIDNNYDGFTDKNDSACK